MLYYNQCLFIFPG